MEKEYYGHYFIGRKYIDFEIDLGLGFVVGLVVGTGFCIGFLCWLGRGFQF